MTDKQPEALRLADEFEATKSYLGAKAAAELRRLHERETELAARLGETIPALEEAAAELDRLHELNVELVEALRRCAASLNPNHEHTAFVFAALAKAEGK